MYIENVKEDDAPELLSIYAIYVEKTAISFEYEIPSVEEFKERIRNISQRYPYIKAVDEGGKILGYAYAGTFKGRRAYDWSVETTIYVRHDLKRNGVGRMLYEALEEMLKEMGILNMNACIAYTDKQDEHLNNDSKHFHEAMGFNLVGAFHQCGYKFGKWYDMIWMEKLIGEHSPEPALVKNPIKRDKEKTHQIKISHGERVAFGLGRELSFEHVIESPLGIHARPAGEIAEIVSDYDCKVIFLCGDKKASGKSVIEMLSLGAVKGSRVKVLVWGLDADKLVEALKKHMTLTL